MISITYNSQEAIADVVVDKNVTHLEFIKFCDYLASNNSFSRFLNVLVKAPDGIKTVNDAEMFSALSHFKSIYKSYDKINMVFTVSNESSEKTVHQFFSMLDENQKQDCFVCKSIKEAKRVLRRNSSSLMLDQKNISEAIA